MAKPSFDVGIIIPLAEEFRYVAEVAPCLESIPYEGTYFYRLDFGPTSAVCCLAGRMGPLPALQAATLLLRFADIKLLVVLGLGGALRADVTVGDVVVAEEINEFGASSKAESTADGYEVRYSGRHWQLAFALREAISHFEFSDPTGFNNWLTHVARDYEALAIPDKEKETVCSSRPSLHVGPIASGNVVAASSAFVEEIKRIDRKFVAIEMEAAGVATAATERVHPLPWLVVRGISDHANEIKTALDGQGKGVWRRYCVRSATAFLRGLLGWEGFLRAAGLQPSDSPKDTEQLAGELVRRLKSCVGGPWIVGVAFGSYSHAPCITAGGAVVPIDVSRIRVSDARAGEIIDSAARLKDELLDSKDVDTAVDGFMALAEDYRNHLSTSEAESLLQALDTVVAEILCPTSDDEEVEPVLLEADRLEEEVGPEAVAELLAPLMGDEPRLRERYIDVLVSLHNWSAVIEVLSRVIPDRVSRRELEHLIFAYVQTRSADKAIEVMKLHKDRHDDNVGQLFRQQLTKQNPGLMNDASGAAQ